MRFFFRRHVHWILAFVLKVLAYIVVFNLAVLPILWVLKLRYLFTLVLVYEALFISIIGVFQILGSLVYRENSIPYRLGFRTGWWNFKKFAKLKPKERQQHRKEGAIMVIMGSLLGCTAMIVHFFVFTY